MMKMMQTITDIMVTMMVKYDHEGCAADDHDEEDYIVRMLMVSEMMVNIFHILRKRYIFFLFRVCYGM